MLFATPELTSALRAQLAELDELRARLGDATGVAGRWLGQLRRETRAESWHSSIAIEGFSVPEADRAQIVERGDADADDSVSKHALACYARAMDHVGTMAIDPHFVWHERVILDLHFDAVLYQRDRSPGLWRTTDIYVTSVDGSAAPAYVGPDANRVPELMAEVVDWLRHGDLDAHVVVRAAMAHLHVVSVHPFGDGNGRISRIVQSLVLALEGLLAPEFSSIEGYLANHSTDYYRQLQAAQGGRYAPGRDATGWVEFCVTAHIAQAQVRLRQIEQASARWAVLAGMVEQRGWPDRLVIALEQASFGKLDRASYVREADVSVATATSDLRRLVDAGLLVAVGRGRSTAYQATPELTGLIERAGA